MKKRKVMVLQEFLVNYRMPVFKKIAVQEAIDFVLVCSRLSAEKKEEGFREEEYSQKYGFRMYRLGCSTKDTVQYWRQLFHVVRLERPDILIAGMWMSSLRLLAFLKLFYGFRLIPWIGGTLFFSDEEIRREIDRHSRIRGTIPINLQAMFYGYCDGFITYSDHAAKYLQSFHHVDREKISIAYNSPDTDVYFDARENLLQRPELTGDLRKKYSAGGEKIIITLGRLNQSREMGTILRAFQIVQNCYGSVSIVIIGDGPEKDNLMRMAKDLGLSSVYCAGALYDDWEIARHFHVAQVYTGIGSLPIKIAMAMGKPVVAIKYGLDAHDIDDGVEGYLVGQGDIASLAARISDLLQNEPRAQAMGRAGLEKMKGKINIDNMVEGFKRAIFMGFRSE